MARCQSFQQPGRVGKRLFVCPPFAIDGSLVGNDKPVAHPTWLENHQVSLDLKDYSIDQVGKIVGILSAMLKQAV